MKYLMYLRDEAANKFPLSNKTLILGRGPECDIRVDEGFVSDRHVRITCRLDHIIVEDLDSTNHTFVKHRSVKKVKIRLDESFHIGYLEFFLKEGNPEELSISPEIWQVVCKHSIQKSIPPEKTKTYLSLFDKTLMEFLDTGCRLNDFEEILGWAKESLSNIFKTGQLMILREKENHIRELSRLYMDEDASSLLNLDDLDRDIWEKQVHNKEIGADISLYSFPLKLSKYRGALLYIRRNSEPLKQKCIDFFKEFCAEVSFVYDLIETNRRPLQDNEEIFTLPTIICKDKAMLYLLNQCKKLAPGNLSILIEGETGAGKELLAKFIHYHSGRVKEKFVAFNCSAVPEDLQETEMFGHKKGAFTDAKDDRTGYLSLSSGGTLLLDEIGDMALSLQAKLLRALQENRFRRVGGDEPVQVDLRVISLTNQDIKKSVAEKGFREDLYYRIAVKTLYVPPLRERPDDILPLINYFLKKFSGERGINVGGFSRKACEALLRYPWPGNVRELKGVIEGLVNLSDSGNIIDFDRLDAGIKAHYLGLFDKTGKGDRPEEITREREKYEKLLIEHRWNISSLARGLNISRNAVYNKLRKLKIQYKKKR
jgi:DNA-binding NtrC family response regulator